MVGSAWMPWLRVDANGVLVLERALFQRGQQLFEIRDQDVCGAHEADVERGVQHIRRGHALVHEARLIVADDLGQMREEGDHVMLGDGLDLVDAGHVELDIFRFPDGLGIGAGNHAQIGLRVAGMGLDLVPDTEFRLGRPYRDHFGAGITRNHRVSLSGLVTRFRRVIDCRCSMNKGRGG